MAVASEICRSFSTSSFVILACLRNWDIILSSFFLFLNWIISRAFTSNSRARPVWISGGVETWGWGTDVETGDPVPAVTPGED